VLNKEPCQEAVSCA